MSILEPWIPPMTCPARDRNAREVKHSSRRLHFHASCRHTCMSPIPYCHVPFQKKVHYYTHLPHPCHFLNCFFEAVSIYGGSERVPSISSTASYRGGRSRKHPTADPGSLETYPLVLHERNLSPEGDRVEHDGALHAHVVLPLMDLRQSGGGILLHVGLHVGLLELDDHRNDA